VLGNLFAFLVALVVVVAVAQSAIALSGPFVWASLVFLGLTSVVLITWRRRAAAAQDLALADAPSFGDVLPHWNKPYDLEPPMSGS
jgi:hypothetical protein